MAHSLQRAISLVRTRRKQAENRRHGRGKVKKLLPTIVLGLAFFSATGAQAPHSYSTNFPATENPISEGGRWINGQAAGLDWKDVRTSVGLAYGADASGNPNYNDPTAILSGTWGPNQTVQATVHSVNQRGGNTFEEVEFRLRTTITAHRNAGYEVNFRCTHDGSQYVQIVRWNGALGNFTYVKNGSVPGPGIRDGDIVRATIVGSTITAYINGVQVVQASDSTYSSGNPGIGFYLQGTASVNGDYGFTSFSASDNAGGTPAPPTPTGARILRALGGLLADPHEHAVRRSAFAAGSWLDGESCLNAFYRRCLCCRRSTNVSLDICLFRSVERWT